MKDNGFTLIELLAVIVILAIIFSIVTISVGKTINDSEKKLSTTQKNIIEHAAEMYYIEDGRNNKIACVSLNTLIDKGYLKANQVKDPQTKEIMDGSVKITIDGKKYSYEYKDDSCIICTKVETSTTGNVPTGSFNYGDEYTCDVGDGENKTFFVLENNTDTVSLIMYANIGVDGKAITSSSTNKSLVAWISKADYVAAGGTESDYGSYGNNNKGPITVTKALKEYTTTWAKLLSSKITLPSTTQIAIASGKTFNGVDSIEDLPTWLNDYLQDKTHSVPEVLGYWTSTPNADNSDLAWIVHCNGLMANYFVGVETRHGIRPVITISKSDIQ